MLRLAAVRPTEIPDVLARARQQILNTNGGSGGNCTTAFLSKDETRHQLFLYAESSSRTITRHEDDHYAD